MNYDGFLSKHWPPMAAMAIPSQDGLGDDHIFWPMFREALKSEGVLGITTLELAVRPGLGIAATFWEFHIGPHCNYVVLVGSGWHSSCVSVSVTQRQGLDHPRNSNARRKWGEWENYQEQMVEKGQLSGNSIITVPGLNYLQLSCTAKRWNRIPS